MEESPKLYAFYDTENDELVATIPVDETSEEEVQVIKQELEYQFECGIRVGELSLEEVQLFDDAEELDIG